jgi:hypothetical protein
LTVLAEFTWALIGAIISAEHPMGADLTQTNVGKVVIEAENLIIIWLAF